MQCLIKLNDTISFFITVVVCCSSKPDIYQGYFNAWMEKPFQQLLLFCPLNKRNESYILLPFTPTVYPATTVAFISLINLVVRLWLVDWADKMGCNSEPRRGLFHDIRPPSWEKCSCFIRKTEKTLICTIIRSQLCTWAHLSAPLSPPCPDLVFMLWRFKSRDFFTCFFTPIDDLIWSGLLHFFLCSSRTCLPLSFHFLFKPLARLINQVLLLIFVYDITSCFAGVCN